MILEPRKVPRVVSKGRSVLNHKDFLYVIKEIIKDFKARMLQRVHRLLRWTLRSCRIMMRKSFEVGFF